MGGIGASVRRLEDPPLLRGAGRFAADINLPGQLHMTSMLQDRHGDLWLGTENQGLLRISAHGLERLPAGLNLPGGRVVSLREDAEGSIWVGANGGLYRLRETLFGGVTRELMKSSRLPLIMAH